ncbi:MAG: L-aspartate oxidase [Fimbriimonadaceae bacterium]|nr:L-aspartate oxidase [Fimbriimonadaceae bacterium]
MRSESFDYLVIGSGLAGLTFALHAANHGRVAVLTKATVTDSNTSWAQGGIAAAVGESDSWELHERDTLVAGAGLCDPAAVRFLVQQAPEAIAWLRNLGARFDLELGREGGHSRHRIVRHADKTGWEIERAVAAAVRSNPAITVYENAFVTELLLSDGRCSGVAAVLGDMGMRSFSARAVMLATGGCGKVYAKTTNPRVATADGIGLADKVGAEITDMEFMQFHPTVLEHPQMPGFLVTEAVRGAGGTLRNHRGDRFMYDYDERLELAPRDIVARAIESEIQRRDTWCVYLDATHLPAEDLREEFPTIWERLRELGIRMERNWIPVVPAQHYSCGGVVTDLNGSTSVPGLYAAGEVSRTGVHGANRLASNSLLEALVFAKSAAAHAESTRELTNEAPQARSFHAIQENEAIRIRHRLQAVMTKHVGVFRTNAGLASAKEEVDHLIADYAGQPSAPFSAYAIECGNLLTAAKHVVEGAIRRKVNVGLHFNADQERATPEWETPLPSVES